MLHVIPWCCKCSLDNACACLIPQMLTKHCMWYPYTESVNTILLMLTLCCRTNLIFEYEPGVANYLILQKVLSRCCKMTWYWVTWLLVKYADLLLNSRSLNYLCWSDSISDDRSQKFIIYPVAVFFWYYIYLYIYIYNNKWLLKHALRFTDMQVVILWCCWTCSRPTFVKLSRKMNWFQSLPPPLAQYLCMLVDNKANYVCVNR